MFSNRRKLVAGIAALALVTTAWLGAFLAWLLLDPSLAQWTLIVTIAAVSTEVALWIGAVVLGITAIQRLRDRFRLFRRRAR